MKDSIFGYILIDQREKTYLYKNRLDSKIRFDSNYCFEYFYFSLMYLGKKLSLFLIPLNKKKLNSINQQRYYNPSYLYD